MGNKMFTKGHRQKKYMRAPLFMVLLFFITISAGGCSVMTDRTKSMDIREIPAARPVTDDGVKFKNEYEILNGQTTPDGEHEYKKVNVPRDNPFIYTDGEGALTLLASGGGVLFFGFPECPWCRTLLPALIAAGLESGYKGNIYYYNALPERDALKLSDDGEIVVESEGASIYHELVKLLYDYLGPYEGLNDESIKRIYFPTTVFFKDGAILSAHLTTVDSQESGYDELTEAQYDELKNALLEKFRALNM